MRARGKVQASDAGIWGVLFVCSAPSRLVHGSRRSPGPHQPQAMILQGSIYGARCLSPAHNRALLDTPSGNVLNIAYECFEHARIKRQVFGQDYGAAKSTGNLLLRSYEI